MRKGEFMVKPNYQWEQETRGIIDNLKKEIESLKYYKYLLDEKIMRRRR